MSDLFALIIFIALFTLIFPVILNIVVFSILAAVVMMLLARLGILPGAVFKRYGGGDGKFGWRWKWKSPKRKDDGRRGEKWYGAPQDGEEITLPETALHKKKDSKKRG
jgi:hypothetical protein